MFRWTDGFIPQKNINSWTKSSIVSWPNLFWQTVYSSPSHIITGMSSKSKFTNIIILRKCSKIQSLGTFRGKSICQKYGNITFWLRRLVFEGVHRTLVFITFFGTIYLKDILNTLGYQGTGEGTADPGRFFLNGPNDLSTIHWHLVQGLARPPHKQKVLDSSPVMVNFSECRTL